MTNRKNYLSAAQIHSVYSMSTKQQAKPQAKADPEYVKVSFASRDPAHPGSPPRQLSSKELKIARGKYS